MEAAYASGMGGGSGCMSEVRNSSSTFASTGERENRTVQNRITPMKSKAPIATILGWREVKTIWDDIGVSFRVWNGIDDVIDLEIKAID